MEKQTTAIQELISEMKNFKTFPLCTEKDRHAIDACIGFAEIRLEKEKQQIIEAHDNGEGKIMGNGENYYNTTYIHNEKSN